jgi:hypothetical protein
LTQRDRDEVLREYAIRVQREVGVRLHHFSPANAEERRQHNQGVVAPGELDANKAKA